MMRRTVSPTKGKEIFNNDIVESNSANMFTDTASILEEVLHNLFDGLSDKDQSIRLAIQNAIVKILEVHPLQAVSVTLKYVEEQTEGTCIILLQAVEKMLNSDADIPYDVYKQLIAFALKQITDSASNNTISAIQKQAINILVAISRNNHCVTVMDDLMRYTKEGTMPHVMIIECYGTIATTNVMGVIPYVKPILKSIVNQLGSLKNDLHKKTYAYAIGRFSEALLEQRSIYRASIKNNDKEEEDGVLHPTSNDVQALLMDSTEISVAYDVLYNQWLPSRDSQICLEVLKALSSLFPLLPQNKIQDQSSRLIPAIFNLYRRSLDRNAVTQFLSSVLETNLLASTNTLDGVIDQLLTNLFDLVSMTPHYDKPYTLKGHYEVLRCFDLLCKEYASQIMDILLIHLRSNSERDRIKSLLILTHLLSTSLERIQNKLPPFLECIKTMITNEKNINMKKTIQRTIVALGQKSFIKEREFIWFIVRHSCKYTKLNEDYGTIEEYDDLMKSCENSLFMLSTTAGTMDELLKRELLNYFVLLDYTDICWNLAGCLASLFSKSPNIEYEIVPNDEENNLPSVGDGLQKTLNVPIKKGKIIIPSPETIYVRCLALLSNLNSIKRTTNILSFMKFYYPHLNPELKNLWEKGISDLLLHINNKEDIFQAKLIKFITDTNDFLNLHDKQFAETLVHKMDEQMIMYPLTLPQSDFVISSLQEERGMLLKCLGLSLYHVKDPQIVATKIDLIITAAKQERLDKNTKLSEFGMKIHPSSISLGYVARVHLPMLIEKLMELIHLCDRKQSTSFFSNLNFMKDTHKELEKINLLIIKTIGQIMILTDSPESLSWLTSDIMNFLNGQLTTAKDITIVESVVQTLLYICERFIQLRSKSQTNSESPLNCRKKIMDAVFNITINPPYDDLHMLPNIFKLGSYFVRLGGLDESNNGLEVESGAILEISCRNFFTVAQNLKTKFESPKEDEFNSFLAQHLNASLPELNILARAFIEIDPSPVSLILAFSILEPWMRDENVEVRTCASRVLYNCLDAHITYVKLDDEGVLKFTETGQIMAKIVPRCMDSNGTVRQLSVDILQQTLIISSIYETLTIADNSIAWMKQMNIIKEQISTDNLDVMYELMNEIGSIIAERISTFQYLQFCKILLQGLKDPEQSSAIGSAVILKYFIEQKGLELFHAISDLVNDALIAIKNCKIESAKTAILEGLVALTKYHPKLMLNEMLAQKLPYEENIVQYWHLLCMEEEVISVILDDFLQMIETSNLLEDAAQSQSQLQIQSQSQERQNIASVRLFAVFCALHEMMPCIKLYNQLNETNSEMFAMLLTSLATYTNVAAPMLSPANDNTNKSLIKPTSGKYKFGFIPNKDTVKLNPCQIVMETLQSFLKNIQILQISDLLDQYTILATSSNLKNFIEFLKKMVPLLKSNIASDSLEYIVRSLNHYVSSTYEGQRVAAIGFYSNLIHLKPSSVVLISIMEHCTHALSDPSPVVRGLCIQGMGYINYLDKNDINKYIDVAINALLKGIDDSFSDAVINIPLESMCGLSRILHYVPTERMESIQVSLGIRLRPFFGNYSLGIREAAITLFGTLCERSSTSYNINDAMREQLLANLFPLVLHLNESESQIVIACRNALLKVCDLLNSDKIKEIAYDHLNIKDQLNYYHFIHNFVKTTAMELNEHIHDFIDTCVPNLRSHWPNVRSSSAIVIGILNNFLFERSPQTDAISLKIAALLKDNHKDVRVHAANALGYFYGDI